MSAQVPARKYRIERYLAEGGMGAIYLGKKIGPSGFEKELVLKQLLPEFTARPEFRDLFFREAKISATLDHVNIVRTVDLVRSEDALFIVMEYVRGTDLRTISVRARRKRKSLSAAAVLHMATEILTGLAYAHAKRSARGQPLGIIHRDVSPSNILCSSQGDVKLSDFGIAKAVNYSSVFYRVRGKVGYMSPEQARNQPIDARSDLFSLAVCVFETLTGERLYTGDLQTPADVVYAQPIPSLTERCPGAPAELEEVMRKALSQDANERFEDAATFAQALRQVARRHGLSFSAPELAAELTNLLGPNPDLWRAEDPPVSAVTEKIAEPNPLEGKEAASIGIVDLSPGARSFSEDSPTVRLRGGAVPNSSVESTDGSSVDEDADADADLDLDMEPEMQDSIAPAAGSLPAAAGSPAPRASSPSRPAWSPASTPAAAVSPLRGSSALSLPASASASASASVPSPPSRPRRRPQRLFLASAAAVIAFLLAVGLFGEGASISAAMKSLRQKIAAWR